MGCKGNIFRPTKILSHKNISKIKISNGRVIIIINSLDGKQEKEVVVENIVKENTEKNQEDISDGLTIKDGKSIKDAKSVMSKKSKAKSEKDGKSYKWSTADAKSIFQQTPVEDDGEEASPYCIEVKKIINEVETFNDCIYLNIKDIYEVCHYVLTR